MSRIREDQFNVFLHNNLVGRLHRREDVTRFIFDENYWQNPDRPVLGLYFEENRAAKYQSQLRLPSWFSNLLPEGRLRQWIADARNASVQREMELLAQVGHDLPGAVKVVVADSLINVEKLYDEEISKNVQEFNSIWSFSLAGVGLKFSMLANGDRLSIPARGEGGDWIVKLPDSKYRCVPRNEFAMMTLAGMVGIDVPEIKMINRDLIEPLPEQVWNGSENWAYAIKRFDRDQYRRAIHMEDMAQVRGFYPEQKYSGSFETVAALIYRGRDVDGLREFCRRMVFNVLIGNGDAHLKNWSLLYKNGKTPTLSPAYDLVSTFIYRPSDMGPEEIALKFGRYKSIEKVNIFNFKYMAQKLDSDIDFSDLIRDFVGDVVNKVEAVPDMFDGCQDLGVLVERFVRERAKQFLGA